MNEPRVIFRTCAECGKEIEVHLSGKDHWWEKRKVLSGGYFFDVDLDSRSMSRGWHSKFLFDTKSKSKVHQFLADHIWWWSIPEQECSVANWKKPFYHLYWWVEDRLDPPERLEYWECEECYNKDV